MKRNKFSLSHYKLLSCDMGELIPVSCVDVLPGDSIQMSSSALIRLSPLVAPVMHPVLCRIHHFFIPLRLLWDNFEQFITGGPSGTDATVWPNTVVPAPASGNLADYMGLGGAPALMLVSALPFRAYHLIWNEYYRDQDLQTAMVISKADGLDGTGTLHDLQRCCWEKDYFTTCRATEQKGPAIGFGGAQLREAGVARTIQRTAAGANTAVSVTQAGGAAGTLLDITLFNNSMLNLRQNLALQRFAEARSRYGSRYVDYLSYIGVQSQDCRLERPEYLGGQIQTVQMSEVLQTGPTTSGSQVGVADLKGHGIASMRTPRWRKHFTEHGLVMSMMSVLPKTMYYQGVPRMFSRSLRTDYWQRELEQIGQQAVLNKEIYGAAVTPSGVFGYQDRYDEYRRMESTVSGDFRSTLNFWHMGRDFGVDPALNQTFVSAVPTKRIHAVQTNDVLLCMVNHSIQARRLLAKSGSESRAF